MQGLTLEKVEDLFSKPWRERLNVVYYLRCSCFLDPIRGRGGRGRRYQTLQVAMVESSSNGTYSEDREHLVQDQEEQTAESDTNIDNTNNTVTVKTKTL